MIGGFAITVTPTDGAFLTFLDPTRDMTVELTQEEARAVFAAAKHAVARLGADPDDEEFSEFEDEEEEDDGD